MTRRRFSDLKIKIYADSGDFHALVWLVHEWPFLRGITTNPSLLHKAGRHDYAKFGQQMVELIPNLPISFEVTTDDFETMEAQARIITNWGENVFVKIPIMNTTGESSCDVIRRLSHADICVNVTALFTLAQVSDALAAVRGGAPSILSIFAGRIADTGRSPVPIIEESVRRAFSVPSTSILWASARELYNIVQAEQAGCHIITLPIDLIKKLDLIGKDLNQFSLETVQMFYRDAQEAGLTL